MDSSKETNCVQVCEEIDHVKLQGSIDWKINDILDWVGFLDHKQGHRSSHFTFDFPDVKKQFKFSLHLLRPKPNKKDPDLKDFISIYLNSCNHEKLNVSHEFYFQGKDGIKQNSRGKVSAVFVGKILVSNGWGYRKFLSIPELKEKADLVLENGCLTIVCDFTIFYSIAVHKNTKRPNSNHKVSISPTFNEQLLCKKKCYE